MDSNKSANTQPTTVSNPTEPDVERHQEKAVTSNLQPSIKEYYSDSSDLSGIHQRQGRPRGRANVSTKRSPSQVVTQETFENDAGPNDKPFQESDPWGSIPHRNMKRGPGRQRPVVIQHHDNGCRDPSCRECSRNARDTKMSTEEQQGEAAQAPGNSDSPLHRTYRDRPVPSYNYGPAIVQPAHTRPRNSSRPRGRPQTFTGEYHGGHEATSRIQPSPSARRRPQTFTADSNTSHRPPGFPPYGPPRPLQPFPQSTYEPPDMTAHPPPPIGFYHHMQAPSYTLQSRGPPTSTSSYSRRHAYLQDDPEPRRTRSDRYTTDSGRSSRDAEEHILSTRGTRMSSADATQRTAKRLPRIPVMENYVSSSSEELDDDNETRLRVDASKPLALSFNEDMEGRTLQLVPAENGMCDVIIRNARAERDTATSQTSKRSAPKRLEGGTTSRDRRTRERDAARPVLRRSGKSVYPDLERGTIIPSSTRQYEPFPIGPRRLVRVPRPPIITQIQEPLSPEDQHRTKPSLLSPESRSQLLTLPTRHNQIIVEQKDDVKPQQVHSQGERDVVEYREQSPIILTSHGDSAFDGPKLSPKIICGDNNSIEIRHNDLVLSQPTKNPVPKEVEQQAVSDAPSALQHRITVSNSSNIDADSLVSIKHRHSERETIDWSSWSDPQDHYEEQEPQNRSPAASYLNRWLNTSPTTNSQATSSVDNFVDNLAPSESMLPTEDNTEGYSFETAFQQVDENVTEKRWRKRKKKTLNLKSDVKSEEVKTTVDKSADSVALTTGNIANLRAEDQKSSNASRDNSRDFVNPDYGTSDEYESEQKKREEISSVHREVGSVSISRPETIDRISKYTEDQMHVPNSILWHEVIPSGTLPTHEGWPSCSICLERLPSDEPWEIYVSGSLPIDNYIRCAACKAKQGINGRAELHLYDSGMDNGTFNVGYSHEKTSLSDVDDASSAMTSCAASVVSVFSVESLASSASDLSRASGYSAMQIATATKVLMSIFHEDEILLPLYEHAMESPLIGPERLQRNLRRLIKAYAEHLDSEAKDRLEYLASRLVSMKARWLAASIIEKHQKRVAVLRKVANERQDESSDDEANDRTIVNERVFEDLGVFREFLTSSNAFEVLRDQVRMFVFPRSGEPTRSEAIINDVLCDDMTMSLLKSKERHGRSWKNWQRNLIEVADGYLRLQAILPPATILLYLAIDGLHLATDRLLIKMRLLEPPLDPGRTRLRWCCKCGESLMSDVSELQKGGAIKLAAQMEQHSGVRVSTMPYNRQSRSQQYVVPRPGRWLRTGLTKLTATITKSSKPTPCLPQHNTSCPSTTSTSSQTTMSQPPMLHLLACMHHSRFRKVLQQDRIETIDTDRTLLCFMRQQYKRHRGRLLHFLSLKSVQGIFFVKFRLPLGGSVDVRHHDPCCVSALAPQPGCECIPPKDKVEPSPDAEYRCIPGPPATYPPVPPEYLRSIFTCPTDVDEKDTWILNQLPKRICGELQGKVGQPADGWGIYYQEDWDWDVIVLFVFVIFLLASLLFGILYSKFQFDVQGAFGVSAYIAALCTIILSLIATRAGRAR